MWCAFSAIHDDTMKKLYCKFGDQTEILFELSRRGTYLALIMYLSTMIFANMTYMKYHPR